jgi:hypothetical protein
MEAIVVKRPRLAPLTLLALGLALAACAPAAAPSKPAAVALAAQPTASAPATPAAQAPPAAVDEQAVGAFYRGKTIRLVVGYAPGGSFDLHARVLARYLSQYVPGNPNVIVENKPGAGGFVATNLVYASEPKDGTVINLVGAGLPLQQALGKEGIQFDVTKMSWLGSGTSTVSACAARVETGITSVQEVIGPNAKQLVVAAIGPGTTTFDTPSVLTPPWARASRSCPATTAAPRCCWPSRRRRPTASAATSTCTPARAATWSRGRSQRCGS